MMNLPMISGRLMLCGLCKWHYLPLRVGWTYRVYRGVPRIIWVYAPRGEWAGSKWHFSLQSKYLNFENLVMTWTDIQHLYRTARNFESTHKFEWAGSKGHFSLGGESGWRSPHEALDVHTLILAHCELKQHLTANTDIYSEWISEFWKLSDDLN